MKWVNFAICIVLLLSTIAVQFQLWDMRKKSKLVAELAYSTALVVLEDQKVLYH